MEWLIGPLPDDKKLVTLGVTEPFTTSVKVSMIAALALALPVDPLAGVGVPRARRSAALRARRPRVRRLRHGALRHRRRVHVHDRPAASARLPHVVRREHLRHPDPRELLLHVRRDDAARRRTRVPHADLRPRARAPSRPDLRVGSRKNRRIAYVALLCSRSCCRPSIPVSLAFEVVPLLHPLRDVDLALGAHGAPLGSRLGRGVRRSRLS